MNPLSSLSWPEQVFFSYGPFAKNAKKFSSYSKSVLIDCTGDFFVGIHGYAIMQAWLEEIKPLISGSNLIVIGGSRR